MPRPRNHHGRPGTQIIPTRWDEHHEPVSRRTLSGRCRVTTDGGPGIFDPEVGHTVPAPRPVLYDGGYRLQQLSQAARIDRLGGQALRTTAYLLVIRRPAAGISLGALVDFHDEDPAGQPVPCDPDLAGKPFYVATVTRGSYRWERDLTIVDDLALVPQAGGGQP